MPKNKGVVPPSSIIGKVNPIQPIGISKIDIGGIKNGCITSQAPTKPQKPTKGK